MSIILLFILFLGYVVQAAVGFGSTLIIVTLGSHVVPLTVLLPMLIPLDVAMTLSMVIQERAHIDRRALGRVILPLMGLGMALGMSLVPFGDWPALRQAFAVFVVGLSLVELGGMARAGGLRAAEPPLSAPGDAPRSRWRWVFLLAGGVAHGIFATGGPLVVAWAGKALPDKRVFRATLTALWLVTSFILLGRYALSGHLNAALIPGMAAGFVPMGLGMWVGNRLHHRVDPARFRLGVYVLLLGAGLALLLRA